MNKKSNKIFNGVKEFFKLKSWLILIVILFLGISISFLIINFKFGKDIILVKADSSDNVAGYAWSETIGWISFNCTNDSSCDVVDYGVTVDPSTGDFSGYAWSSNVGWISFERTDTGTPPAQPYQDVGETKIANYDSSTGNVNGWVKILSLGNDGWISFNTTGTPDYGVSIVPATGEFTGWAWNGNSDEGVGIGWISFNCLDTSSCDVVDYKVTGNVNILPVAENLSAPNWTQENACSYGAKQAIFRWNFIDPDVGADQTAYQIIFDDDDNIADPVVDTGKVDGIPGESEQYIHGSSDLVFNTTYWWWVKVWDNNDTSAGFVAGTPFTTYKHELPDVNFSYFPTSPSQGEEVQFTDFSTADISTSITDWLWSGDYDTISPTSATSTNSVMIFDEGGIKTVNLQVTDGDGYFCSESKDINITASLPRWQEIKPR